MRIKKIICTAVAVSVLGFSTVGCSGSYALFNKAHPVVSNIGGKYVGAVIHWISWGIGILPICILADVLIFNLLEFWTGSNPVAMGDTFEELDANGNRIYAVKNADGTLNVSVTNAEGETVNVVLEQENGTYRMRKDNGEVIALNTFE